MKEKDKGAASVPEVKSRAVNPMIFLVIVVLLCAIASYLVPAGSFERVYSEELDREIVNAENFTWQESKPTTLMGLLLSLTLGMQHASDIIFFLLIIGGMFGILNATGAIETALANVVRKLKNRELVMIPVCMIVFGCGSCFCGNFEEFLAFVPLVLACTLSVGFDSLTAVAIVFCAATAGYGGAMTNAFTVGVAQGIAGLPMFSGIELRAVLFCTLLAASIAYVMFRAARVKRDPKLSPVWEIDEQTRRETKLSDVSSMTGRHWLVLAAFFIGMAFTVWGIIVEGYYIDELAAVFLATGVVAGIVGGLGPSRICDAFTKGCVNMLFPCLMIGLANAATHIMREAGIMDTIIYALASVLDRLPSALLACGMFVVQDIFNVLVPSGSGQAAITMPIMAPLSDMLHITRQTAVLAFQLGDAFTNILAPTGGEILAALAICRVPFRRWVSYLLPLFAIWCLIAFGFLIYATQTNYGPF